MEVNTETNFLAKNFGILPNGHQDRVVLVNLSVVTMSTLGSIASGGASASGAGPVVLRFWRGR